MKGLSQPPLRESCFGLTLTNLLLWELLAADELVIPWVKHLAAIMNLSFSKIGISPKLIFIHEDPYANGSRFRRSLLHIRHHAPGIPLQGWEEQNLGIVRFWRHPESLDIICAILENRRRDIRVTQMWTALSPIYEAVQNSGGLLFHGGLAELNSSGVLLVGPSGAGKSTCSRRIPPPWRPLCDDEVLVVRDDLNQYHAHPFPTWQELICGDRNRSWDVQQYVPLKALFFLNRSNVDEVRPILPGKAAVWIYKSIQEMRERNDFSVTHDKEKALTFKLFENVCMLAKSVPCFTLGATLTGRFWEEMEKVL
ncbi:MAG TPA: SynChlorMet cassette protein ScmC [Desulfomonilaceae bacterium]|nr:SynChlorMet cassette protein ScmC [Desulfomonilaceae bacterium]